MKLENLRALFASVTLGFFVSLSPSAAFAAPVHGIDISGIDSNNNGFDTGWRFTTSQTITVTALGKFTGATPANASEVALYDDAAGGARRAFANVLSSSPSEASGDIAARYVDVAPVVLLAGTYVVYGQGNGEVFVEHANTAALGTGIAWNAGIANSASASPLALTTPTFSITNTAPYRYFGATFKYELGDTTPEPSSFALITVGAFSLFARRRAR